jgi:hypothetical protein
MFSTYHCISPFKKLPLCWAGFAGFDHAPPNISPRKLDIGWNAPSLEPIVQRRPRLVEEQFCAFARKEVVISDLLNDQLDRTIQAVRWQTR